MIRPAAGKLGALLYAADDVHGDEDRDRVLGGGGGDQLLGDYHGDTVIGGGGADFICGDECAPGAPQGPDLLSGGLDGDTLVAEGGVDRLREKGNFNMALESDLAATLSGGGGQEFLGDRIERITLIGGPGANRLRASGYELGGVTLIGRGGDDRLVGSPQRDRLAGGPDDDRIRAEDRRRDRVLGGPGFDRAAVDRVDVVRGVEQRT